MMPRCIYCGFEVGTGMTCCGVKYNLNGTYNVPMKKVAPPVTPVQAIIGDLRQSLVKCWHMPKPAVITMHPVGFKLLRDYLLSTQASVQEKMALASGPTFDGMKVVENPLLKDHQFVITDKDCNILCVGSVLPSNTPHQRHAAPHQSPGQPDQEPTQGHP